MRFIHAVQSGFFLVASHEYDQSLDIINSSRKNFPVEFDQDVEPGIIQVFDFEIRTKISLNKNDGVSQTFEIRIASMRDDEF